MSRAFLIVCLASAPNALIAQVGDTTRAPYHSPRATRHRELTLLSGYDQGRAAFGELGVAYNIYGTNHHPYALAWFVASEVKVDDDLLIAPKVGVWVAGGVAMGVQAIYYTDLGEGSLAIRPEFGIGLFKFKVTYGYNIRVTNSAMEHINSHVLNLTYCFRLKRLKGDDYLK